MSDSKDITPYGWINEPLSTYAADEPNSFVDGPFGSDLKVCDYTEDGVRILQLQNLGDGQFINDNVKYTSKHKASSLSRCMVRPGDLIIAKMAEPLARACIVPNTVVQGLIVADLIKLRLDRRHDPTFISSAINGTEFRREAERLSTGTTRTRVSLSTIKRIHLKIPQPNEQRKIGDLIRTMDETIEQTEALIAKYQQIKSGLMHDLFTRGITPDGHLRPTREHAPTLYKASPLGWIPKEWEVGRLSDYLDPINGIKPGPFGSSITKDNYTASGFRVYGQEQVIAGSLEVGDYFISPSKFAEMRGFEVLANDVLLSLVGTVGCVLVVEPPFEPGIINPRLIRLRPGRDIALAHFLKYLLLTAGIRRQLDSLAGGGTMSVINGKVIRRLVAPLLAIHEQERIVERLDALDQSVISWSDDLSKLRQQKQGLMQDLLTGRMRVPVGVAGRLDRTDQSDQSDPSDVFARSYRSDPTAQSDKNRRSIKP